MKISYVNRRGVTNEDNYQEISIAISWLSCDSSGLNIGPSLYLGWKSWLSCVSSGVKFDPTFDWALLTIVPQGDDPIEFIPEVKILVKLWQFRGKSDPGYTWGKNPG